MSWEPLIISLKTAIVATAIAFVLGIVAAGFVMKLAKLKGFVDALFTLPLVLPPTVVGFFLLLLFGKNSVIGRLAESFGQRIIFTPVAGVIAAVVVAFPLVYRTSRGAFEQFDVDLIHAGRTLGKGEGWIFFRVVLPNCWSGILAGGMLAFARAMGEFGATIMIAGNIPGKTQTMALAVYTAMQSGNRELAWKWVTVMMIISLAILIILNGWLGQRRLSRGVTWR